MARYCSSTCYTIVKVTVLRFEPDNVSIDPVLSPLFYICARFKGGIPLKQFYER